MAIPVSSLQEHNVSIKSANKVSAIYRQAKSCVRGKTEQSRDVPIHQGVLQGNCLPPICLIIVLDSVVRSCECKGIMIGEISINDLRYAYDLGVLESATAKLQFLNQQSMSAGMEINVGKNKAMHIMKKERVTATTIRDVKKMNFQHPCPNCTKIHMARWCTGDSGERYRKGKLADTKVKGVKHSKAAKARENVVLNGLPVENVACFDYMCSIVNAGGGSVEDIEKRMTLAMAKFAGLHHIWGDSQLSRDLRVRLYTEWLVHCSMAAGYSTSIMQLKRS